MSRLVALSYLNTYEADQMFALPKATSSVMYDSTVRGGKACTSVKAMRCFTTGAHLPLIRAGRIDQNAVATTATNSLIGRSI